jgi:hypothetical protein
MMQLANQPFNCTHCGKKFMQEKTLYAHMCEPKRRFMQRDEKRVQAGFFAFNRYYRLVQGAKKDKTYEDCCKRAYYNAFVKFGSFVNNVNPLYPDKFVDYVIKSGVKLDHWCRDQLYETYLYEMIKMEPVESAVQRSLSTMMEWGDAHDTIWTHYFLYASQSRIIQHLRDGKISPWLLFNCESGKEFLKGLNSDQLEMLTPAVDFQGWVGKINKSKADANVVKEVCREAGIP